MTRYIIPALLFATTPAFAEDDWEEPELDIQTYHGFRMGYSYIQTDKLPTPHNYVVGYELTQKIGGGDALSVILVENVMLTGLNQSVIIPSANFLVGFEFADRLQIGAGPNIVPVVPEAQMVHMVMGIGYTMKHGALNVPLHFSVIPDVNGANRFALTTGVNWK